MIKWQDNIITEIALRQCVLYLGSGVSHNSQNVVGERPMTWYTFLKKGTLHNALGKKQKKDIERKLREQDLLMACELLKRYLGDETFYDLMERSFKAPRFNHAEIHEAIFKLDARIVITPNFDNIYETYATANSGGTIVIKNYYDLDISSCIRKRSPMILKLHGSIDSPEKTIFTQVDYAKARTDNTSFYQLLNALLQTQTFLFIGAGLNDPDIKLLLENYAFQYKNSRKHYFLIPKKRLSDKESEILEESLNLKFITYNETNNHQELTDSLKQLCIDIDDKRAEIAQGLSW